MASDLTPLALTQTLLSFDTTNPPGQEQSCAKHLGHLLESAGFYTEYYDFAPTRTTLIARLEGSGEKLPICFTGHLDTVPLGTAGWRLDPFRGEVEDGKLYGRGSSDMKSGVAAMVLAAMHLAQQGDRTAGLTLVLTAGEETCCQGAHHLQQLGVLGQAGAVIAGEPTSNVPLIGHKGAVRFNIRTRGVTAHASMPEQGINAIHKAAHLVIKLQHFDFKVYPHPILGSPTLNIGTIRGGQNINSVPDETVLGLDIRTIPGQAHETIQDQLQAALGPDAEIEYLEDASSIATDYDHEWVQTVLDIVEPVLGERPIPAGATYFTDASVLTPAYGHPPTLILGPGEPQMAHKTNEFCHVSKIDEAAEIYTAIATHWCCS